MMRTGVSGLVAVIIVAIGGVLLPPSAEAATPALTVGLGSADTFSVVAGSYVTLAGSNVGGDVGAVGAVTTAASTVGGVTYELNTAKAPQARADVLAAYTSADGRTPTGAANSGVLGGQTLTAGVHHAVAAYGLTGKLTLDGGGDTGAVFILQTEGAIVAAAGAKIALINGAKAANVFWQTPTHVVLGAGSKVVGTFLAGSYITFGAGSTLEGRAFSNTGYVVLATTSITTPAVVPPVVTPPVVTPPVVVPPVVTPPVAVPPVVPPVTAPAGPQGPAGEDGTDGADGTDGEDGADGATGATGQDGVDGAKGATGKTGQDGADGLGGTDGATGSTGTQGSDGTNGVTGTAGQSDKNSTNGTATQNGAANNDGGDGQNGTTSTQGSATAPPTVAPEKLVTGVSVPHLFGGLGWLIAGIGLLLLGAGMLLGGLSLLLKNRKARA